MNIKFTVIMVINREFFFRGWLPAGLLINARLLTTSPDGETPVLRPVINATPGAFWPEHQPGPIFPIDQASSNSAILLKDPLPEGSLAMLPLGEWYGSGTPFILAVNTWYEGRVQSASGNDVMAIRLLATRDKEYYYSVTGITPPASATPDICITEFACKYIPGKNERSYLMMDAEGASMSWELGVPPRLQMPGSEESQQSFTRVMNCFQMLNSHVAGLTEGWEDKNPDADRRFIECKLVEGQLTRTDGTAYKKFGIIPVPIANVQPIYPVMRNVFMSPIFRENLLNPEGEVTYGVVAPSAGDQTVSYN